jgi:hypothetical protein
MSGHKGGNIDPTKTTSNTKLRHKVYNTKMWRDIRDRRKQEHPVCEDCKKALSTEVHHVDSFMKYRHDKILFNQKAYDYDNTVALCYECHMKRHGFDKLDTRKPIKTTFKRV